MKAHSEKFMNVSNMQAPDEDDRHYEQSHICTIKVNNVNFHKGCFLRVVLWKGCFFSRVVCFFFLIFLKVVLFFQFFF